MFFFCVGHVEQEVHVSENGSAETALDERLKKKRKKIIEIRCIVCCSTSQSYSTEVDISEALLDFN